MDTCNFPELLALDLETAEPIFTARRMTAGAPRPSSSRGASDMARHKRSSLETRTPQWSHNFTFSPLHSHACPKSATHSESKTTSLQAGAIFQSRLAPPFSPYEVAPSQIRVSGAAHRVVVFGEPENYSSFSPIYPTISNDGDNASVDSFEIPNISLVSPRCVRSEQQSLQQEYQCKQLEGEQEEKSIFLHSELGLRDCDRILGDQEISSDSTGAGNKGDDGGDVVGDDDDGDNMRSDTSSVSSLGFATSSVHDCRQSVVTAATSVASASRSSAQSHILSAIGPSSPKSQWRRESMPMSERHVDFKLDTDVVVIDSRSGENSSSDLMADDVKQHGSSCDTSSSRPQHAQQSSWIDFGDDEESDDEKECLSNEVPLWTDEAHGICRPSRQASQVLRPYSPYSRRPSSAMSWFGREKGQSSALHEWTEKKRLSQTSVASVPSLRRRSSLGSYRTAAQLSDRPEFLLPLQYEPPERQNPRQQRQSYHSRSRLSISSNASATPSAREVERMRALLSMQTSGKASGEQAVYSRPASLSQVDGTQVSGNEAEEDRDDADLFADFDEDDFDQEEDEIMTATVVPLSKQYLGSVSPQLGPIDENAATLVNCAEFDAEETSQELQSWIQQTSETQEEAVPHLLRGQDGIFRFENRPRVAHEQEEVYQANGAYRYQEARPLDILQPSVQQKQPTLPLVFQPTASIVAVRLPKEVVDMLRVSVSCFPETMLSLSSFCIQTIRSYSRKVRRISELDGDTENWLLSSPNLLSTLPPSPTGTTPFVPAPMPRPPMSPSMHPALMQDWPQSSRSSTRAGSIAASLQRSSRRFWMVPKRLMASRTTASLGSFVSATGATSAQLRPHSRSNRGGEDNVEMDQDRASGACFKRIFPTGSDYICDSLYAHVLAFNYISMLCSQEFVPSQPSLEPGLLLSAATATGPGCTAPAGFGSESMARPMRMQKRQTIRVYVGSDVNIPPSSQSIASIRSPSPEQPHRQGTVTFLNQPGGDMPSSPPETPPPSREGRLDDDTRLISRKAAILLGIQGRQEPEVARRSSEASSSGMSVSSGVASLGRRYNSLRRRRRKIASGESGETDKNITSKSRGQVKKARPSPLPPTALFDIGRSTLYEEQLQGQTKEVAGCLPLTPPPSVAAAAAAAAAAATETAMHDLQADLYGCIRHLVSTLKLTTGQLGESKLLSTEVQEVDQVLLRTLCELVRSQEEQI